jgi:predicted N-acetyltransferase YhbS
MTLKTFSIRAELPGDDPAINALQKRAFGPGALTRMAFALRARADHLAPLARTAWYEDQLMGSVRFYAIQIGERKGALLGPLVVEPTVKHQGAGRQLLAEAVPQVLSGGVDFIMLIGDRPYYGPFGFMPLASNQLLFPLPVDPARVLLAGLDDAARQELKGMVTGRSAI